MKKAFIEITDPSSVTRVKAIRAKLRIKGYEQNKASVSIPQGISPVTKESLCLFAKDARLFVGCGGDPKLFCMDNYQNLQPTFVQISIMGEDATSVRLTFDEVNKGKFVGVGGAAKVESILRAFEEIAEQLPKNPAQVAASSAAATVAPVATETAAAAPAATEIVAAAASATTVKISATGGQSAFFGAQRFKFAQPSTGTEPSTFVDVDITTAAPTDKPKSTAEGEGGEKKHKKPKGWFHWKPKTESDSKPAATSATASTSTVTSGIPQSKQ